MYTTADFVASGSIDGSGIRHRREKSVRRSESMDSILLLEVNGCSKSFPGVKALDSIDFDLFSGEIHTIVGENGAGKSTLIKILSGALRPDEGTIAVAGKQFTHLSPSLAHQFGITTIFQEVSLASEMTVAENIAMGREPLTRLRVHRLQEDSTATRPACSPSWGSRWTSPSRWPTSASHNASRFKSPGRWPQTPRSSSWTSRPPPTAPLKSEICLGW